MSSACSIHNKVYIQFDSGCGSPYPYKYTIFTKKGKEIIFGYQENNERFKTYKQVKEYINTHHKELKQCYPNECDNYHVCVKGD